MNTDNILTRILTALDSAQPETGRVLTYIFDQIDGGKRDDADTLALIATAKPILKRIGA